MHNPDDPAGTDSPTCQACSPGFGVGNGTANDGRGAAVGRRRGSTVEAGDGAGVGAELTTAPALASGG